MRLRNDPDALIKLQESKMLITNFPIKLNSNDVIELGAGKGEMICQLALNNPNQIFYAVEKYHTVAYKIAKQALKYELKNLFIVCEDIERINEIFTNQVSLIWITFSDPWPKKRHEKRRLTYHTFLSKYRQLLTNNGIIKLKTDNDDFFNYTLKSLNKFNCNINFVTNDLHNSKKNSSNFMTGYEIKWSKKGKKINYCEFNFKELDDH